VPDLAALELADWAFMAALVGWMPSAIDVAAWQSIWTLARKKETAHAPSARESSFDFHLGYVSTAALAVCFVVLGAVVLHQRGVPVEEAPGAFAAQLIALYAETLGEWARPLIGVAALATMFSTTLTVVDGFPRALSVLVDRFRGPEDPDAATKEDRTPVYWGSAALLCAGALVVLVFLASSMRALIDLATTLSFLSAPMLAWLNHRAVTGEEVPVAHRPSAALRIGSLVAIAAMTAFAIGYLVLEVL
jgi:Mn2+/Fe2+ NRAMP family transporter